MSKKESISDEGFLGHLSRALNASEEVSNVYERTLFLDKIKDKLPNSFEIEKDILSKYIESTERYNELEKKRELDANRNGEKHISDSEIRERDLLQGTLYQAEFARNGSVNYDKKPFKFEEYAQNMYLTDEYFNKIKVEHKEDYKSFNTDLSSLAEAKYTTGDYKQEKDSDDSKKVCLQKCRNEVVADKTLSGGLISKENKKKLVSNALKVAGFAMAASSGPVAIGIFAASQLTQGLMKTEKFKGLKKKTLDNLKGFAKTSFVSKAMNKRPWLKKAMLYGALVATVTAGAVLGAAALTGNLDATSGVDNFGSAKDALLKISGDTVDLAKNTYAGEAVVPSETITPSEINTGAPMEAVIDANVLGGIEHTGVDVIKGDTLGGILERFDGVDYDLQGDKLNAAAQMIAEDNGYLNANEIPSGVSLNIPNSPDALKAYMEVNENRLGGALETAANNTVPTVDFEFSPEEVSFHSHDIAADMVANMDQDTLADMIKNSNHSYDALVENVQQGINNAVEKGTYPSGIEVSVDNVGRGHDEIFAFSAGDVASSQADVQSATTNLASGVEVTQEEPKKSFLSKFKR